jgi:endoribonuclease Dicer
LKFTSSTYVFLTYPTDMEGGLHGRRRQIISNQALWECARDIGLAEYILSKSFSVKHWHPAQIAIRSSFNPVVDDDMKPDEEPKDAERGCKQPKDKEPSIHQLGDKVSSVRFRQSLFIMKCPKTLADTVEAIVAASYLSGGHEAVVLVMKALGIPVSDPTQRITLAQQSLPLPPPDFNSSISAESLKKFEKIIGHPLKKPYYFHQVLVRYFLIEISPRH